MFFGIYVGFRGRGIKGSAEKETLSVGKHLALHCVSELVWEELWEEDHCSD